MPNPSRADVVPALDALYPPALAADGDAAGRLRAVLPARGTTVSTAVSMTPTDLWVARVRAEGREDPH